MEHLRIREAIRRKLGNGDLPADRPEKLNVTYGRGGFCDGCSQALHPAQIEYEFTYPDWRASVRMHLGCAALWEALRLKGGLGSTL